VPKFKYPPQQGKVKRVNVFIMKFLWLQEHKTEKGKVAPVLK
jgi:hypothetical protein